MGLVGPLWPCGGSSRPRSRNPQTGPHRSRGRRRETAAGRGWQRPYDRQRWRAGPSGRRLPTPTCRRSRRTRTASMTIAGNSQKWGAQTGPQGAGRGYPNDAAREGTGAVRRPQKGPQGVRGRAAGRDRAAGCTRGRAAPQTRPQGTRKRAFRAVAREAAGPCSGGTPPA